MGKDRRTTQRRVLCVCVCLEIRERRRQGSNDCEAELGGGARCSSPLLAPAKHARQRSFVVFGPIAVAPGPNRSARAHRVHVVAVLEQHPSRCWTRLLLQATTAHRSSIETTTPSQIDRAQPGPSLDAGLAVSHHSGQWHPREQRCRTLGPARPCLS